MKRNTRIQKWLPLAALSLTLASQSALAASDLLIGPGAIQPDGDPNDQAFTPQVMWRDGAADATAFYIPGVSSSNNIAGSILVDYDAPGGAPANIMFQYLAVPGAAYVSWPDGNSPSYDMSRYESLSFDIQVVSEVSSNVDFPLMTLGPSWSWGGRFNDDNGVPSGQVPDYNAAANGYGFGITKPGWNHIVIPLNGDRVQPVDVQRFGGYLWYQADASTPPGHLQFYIDNIRFAARKVTPPPPTIALKQLKNTGLMADTVSSETGGRQHITTVNSVPWEGNASASSPVIYSMTITAVPDPSIYSNYEAHIFLAPRNDIGNPDNNATDTGWLRILDNSDGTATATMHWKTNSAFNYTMLWNAQVGGEYGTNGWGAGFLATMQAPTILGTWSISFTSDTDFTVKGPGGIQTNLTIPREWVDVWDADAGGIGPVAYPMFGIDPNTRVNQGQAFLSNVTVSGGGAFGNITNDFTTELDTTVWDTLGDNIFVVTNPAWIVSWSTPASYFSLFAAAYLTNPIPWVDVTNNPAVPVNIYKVGTNIHALVADADLPDPDHTFFVLQRSVAYELQVLMPGETSAPGSITGKSGTPLPQKVGVPFNVTVNAVDSQWNLKAGCTDPVNITSSDPAAAGTGTVTLVGGTATFSFTFNTTPSQTITATDGIDATVEDTGSQTTVNP